MRHGCASILSQAKQNSALATYPPLNEYDQMCRMANEVRLKLVQRQNKRLERPNELIGERLSYMRPRPSPL